LDPEEDGGEQEQHRASEKEDATDIVNGSSLCYRLFGTYATAGNPLAPPHPINTMLNVKVAMTKLSLDQHNGSQAIPTKLTQGTPEESHWQISQHSQMNGALSAPGIASRIARD
jgi:hypothetical protein